MHLIKDSTPLLQAEMPSETSNRGGATGNNVICRHARYRISVARTLLEPFRSSMIKTTEKIIYNLVSCASSVVANNLIVFSFCFEVPEDRKSVV